MKYAMALAGLLYLATAALLTDRSASSSKLKISQASQGF